MNWGNHLANELGGFSIAQLEATTEAVSSYSPFWEREEIKGPCCRANAHNAAARGHAHRTVDSRPRPTEHWAHWHIAAKCHYLVPSITHRNHHKCPTHPPLESGQVETGWPGLNRWVNRLSSHSIYSFETVIPLETPKTLASSGSNTAALPTPRM